MQIHSMQVLLFGVFFVGGGDFFLLLFVVLL